MPVILDDVALSRWLDPSEPEPLDALRGGSLAAEELYWFAVSKKMSKLDYQEADCASPVKLVSQQQKSVATFFAPRRAGRQGLGAEVAVAWPHSRPPWRRLGSLPYGSGMLGVAR